MTKPDINGFISRPEISFWVPTAIGILVPIIGFAVLWGTLNADVKAQKEELNAVKQTVAEYPSKDYFDLKFATIDQQLLKLDQTISNHIETK